MKWFDPAVVGRATRTLISDIGNAARLFLRLLALLGPSVKRFGLIRDQIHFLGNCA